MVSFNVPFVTGVVVTCVVGCGVVAVTGFDVCSDCWHGTQEKYC